MPKFDERHVKINGGFVVWDGVTQPEVVQQGAKAGSNKWTLKVVFEPHNPDLALYNELAQGCLQQSKFRGQLPAGGRMPIGQVQPGEFNDMFVGWSVISFKTTLKMPDMFDENGAPVDPMQLNQLFYVGQKVDVLAHCYEYDAAGNRGIAAGLDAFAIIASANAPRLQFGTGGVNTAAAFGGQQPPAYGQAPQGQAPQGQQPPAYGQQPPAYGQQPPAYGQQPPAYGQQPPAYGQGQGQAPQGQAPQGQAPQGQAPQGQQPPAYGQAPQGQAPQGQGQAPQGQQPPAYGQGQQPPAYGQPPQQSTDYLPQ